MRMTRSRQAAVSVRVVLAAGVVCVGGWRLMAQAPPQAGAPAVQAGTAQAPPGGRQGGGGPGANDPANATADYSPKPPVLPRSPGEQAKLFELRQGFRMEPVLTDPTIEEAAQIAFDGNGRMFVLEIRGYMQDADATEERAPVGRISVHEDVNNDGVYEKHSVFVDKLVFPRFVMPIGANSILTMETDADDVWRYTDTNGDGVADKKEFFANGFGRGGNVEHQQAHLTWAMDNWLYSTYNSVRLRWTPTGVLREPTGNPGGAWGVTQDNFGKTYIQGGASGQPGYFQFPIVYGNFNWGAERETDLTTPYGAAIGIADMQGGLPIVRMPDGSLARTTAGAGNDIYRGDRLPADLVGNYFYGETVARVVRRIKIDKVEGLSRMTNAYPGQEFIRSTDPLFRPTDMTTAPDGTMYITDMYRGIIQEAAWTGPGTYLRKKIEQYQLDKVVRHGRIWRLSYDGIERDRTQPRMLNETPAQLVARLSHPNGWWRDTAQQLLVLKQDKSVVPALQRLVRTRGNVLPRIHALWTLEGLGALDAAFVREQLKDTDPQLRAQAIRASETLYKAGDRTLAADWRGLLSDRDADVVVQAMLTVNHFNVPDAKVAIKTAAGINRAAGVQHLAGLMLNTATAAAGRGGGGGGRGNAGPARSAEETALLTRGETIYKELCNSCHGDDGRGNVREGTAPGTTMAPPLASPRVTAHRDYTIKVLLHGLTGPLNGQTFSEVMVPMGTNQDDWIAAIASHVRNSFGNAAPVVSAADVARVRAATTGRKTMWTVDELEASTPRLIPVDPNWKVTASHNAANARAGITFAGWNSGAPQAAGMWFQVELPQATRITELQFESTGTGRGGGGGGGRGAAGAGAAPVAPPTPGFPQGYKVEVSMDGTAWTSVAQGQGTGASTVILFAPVQAKFVRLTQTADTPNAPALSIQRLRVYEQR